MISQLLVRPHGLIIYATQHPTNAPFVENPLWFNYERMAIKLPKVLFWQLILEIFFNIFKIKMWV
jgi:hypothetical protein